jgi:hypothetical protein
MRPNGQLETLLSLFQRQPATSITGIQLRAIFIAIESKETYVAVGAGGAGITIEYKHYHIDTIRASESSVRQQSGAIFSINYYLQNKFRYEFFRLVLLFACSLFAS